MRDLSLLKHNLQSIYTSHPIGSERDLVSFGTTIYHTSTWMGYLVQIIHCILGVFVGTVYRNKALIAAISKTIEIFDQNHTAIASHVKKYHYYLHRMIQRRTKNINEEEYGISRLAITRWNDATKPFLKYIRRNGLKSIFDIFCQNLGLNSASQLDFLHSFRPRITPIFCTNLLEDCIKYQRVIDFQALCRQHNQGQLFETIARLNNEQVLMFEHRKILRMLTAQINEICKNKKNKKKFFHKVLNDIVELIPNEENQIKNVKREFAIAGCEIFQEKMDEAKKKLLLECFDVDIPGLPETICDFR